MMIISGKYGFHKDWPTNEGGFEYSRSCQKDIKYVLGVFYRRNIIGESFPFH